LHRMACGPGYRGEQAALTIRCKAGKRLRMTDYEPVIRLSAFVAVLVVMGICEAMAPRRSLTGSKPARWFSNLTLAAINAFAIRLAFAIGAVGVALEAQSRGWGLFNNVSLPGWLATVLGVLALDLAIYLQHVLFHAVPAFWRLHMVHHADPDFDVTTGLRFHTIEIALSMGIKVAAIMVVGPPALAVLIFEVLLNATSMFSHSNLRLPIWLDRMLRLVVVTPDMHRVHHSTIRNETNSNYGFNMPWWDYLFGTYRAQPVEGHEAMKIGLNQIPPARAVGLTWLLTLPFIGAVGNYPIKKSE
jgi:sterol desaturase/sphingolipid hydroxylase (fatty acid hydroxylase superfamily)